MSIDNDKELAVADIGTLAVLSKAEIDQQIATAHQYPRSIKRFLDESRDLVTLSEEVAEECIYSLPRGGKTIEGPSARFSEVIFSSWGNCRAGARVIGEDAEFVTAQGFFHDLEKNAAMAYEVKRRITDKYGKRYNADMVAVTANAACSIAMRNAILKGIPKSIWATLYNEARRVVAGDEKTLVARRDAAMTALQKMGATKEQVLALLQVQGVEDIGQDELVTLRGVVTAVRDGATTVDKAFAKSGPSKSALALAAKATAPDKRVDAGTRNGQHIITPADIEQEFANVQKLPKHQREDAFNVALDLINTITDQAERDRLSEIAATVRDTL